MDISDDSPCPAPSSTLVAVDHCPDSKETWNKAAKRKKCHQIGSEECKLEYHCVVNSYGNVRVAIEVCAVPRLIFGGYCPEFNNRSEIIQEGAVACKKHRRPCYLVFLSTDAYKFQECYMYRAVKSLMVESITLSLIKRDSTNAEKKCLKAINGRNHGKVLHSLPLIKRGNSWFLDTLVTMESVEDCPFSKESWSMAASLKKCTDINNSCKSFLKEPVEYHCLKNPYLNETVEVCAPSRPIIGGFCAEYSPLARQTQPNFDVKCTTLDKKCPFVYSSSESFKYQECYESEADSIRTLLEGMTMDLSPTTPLEEMTMDLSPTPRTIHHDKPYINYAAAMTIPNYFGAVFGGMTMTTLALH